MDAYRAALGTVYSSKLPKSNPFWIKVQGIPLHFWTEDIIRLIGQDIRVYEKAEITTLVVRMRVHINGRLPLIKSSVLELSNGEDITASLVYEKLDKHCTYCQRLDHENRDCLKAKADKREALIIAVSMADKSQSASSPGRHPQGNQQRRTNSYTVPEKSEENWNNIKDREDCYSQRSRCDDYHKQGTGNAKVGYGKNIEERTSLRKRFHPYQHQRDEYHAPSRYHQPRNMIYRETQRSSQDPLRMPPPPPPVERNERRADGYREESSASKVAQPISARGTPLRNGQLELPREVVDEALGELREAMTQYTLCTDPTESAARKERMRKAEEEGDFEETAIQMARTALATKAATFEKDRPIESAERIPALLRLGSPILTPAQQGDP